MEKQKEAKNKKNVHKYTCTQNKHEHAHTIMINGNKKISLKEKKNNVPDDDAHEASQELSKSNAYCKTGIHLYERKSQI